MRVCLVNSFYPPYIGGAETYVSNLARNLSDMGNEVTVFCSDKPLGAGITYDGEVRVVRMRAPLTFYGTPLASFPASFIVGDYDVVHCNFPNPYFAAVSGVLSKARGVPAVLTWHNDLPPVTGSASMLVGLNRILSTAYLAPYSRIIATTSVYARKSLVLRGQSDKLEVIPNGVDTERFSPEAESENAKKRYNLNGFKTLIFVGALTTWHTYKGLEELLQALALVQKTCDKLKLLVVGGGNLLGHYLRMAQKLHCADKVVFAGSVDDEYLPQCYAASDFAVLPSRDSSEGFGLSLLEAMASGKAVVGSDVGGIPEVIQNRKNGILVEPRNPVALADAIHSLYENDELRTRMGEAGREFAESRTWRRVAERVDSIYEGIQ